MKKIISFDYDGTLWEEDGSGPIFQLNRLKEYYEQQGYKTIIVTSRAPEYLDEIRENYPDTSVYSAYDKGKFFRDFDEKVETHFDNNPSDIIDVALCGKNIETVFVGGKYDEVPDIASRRIILFRDL